MARPKRQADCHPERPHASRGLCQPCYQAARLRDRPGLRASRVEATRLWRAENGVAVRQSRREKWASDPEFARDYEYRSKYGIGAAEVDAMLVAQKGLCLICKKDIVGRTKARAKACVDHCHATKKVRGLLCFRCNSSLGAFNDDPELVDRAAAYLRKHAP